MFVNESKLDICKWGSEDLKIVTFFTVFIANGSVVHFFCQKPYVVSSIAEINLCQSSNILYEKLKTYFTEYTCRVNDRDILCDLNTTFYITTFAFTFMIVNNLNSGSI